MRGSILIVAAAKWIGRQERRALLDLLSSFHARTNSAITPDTLATALAKESIVLLLLLLATAAAADRQRGPKEEKKCRVWAQESDHVSSCRLVSPNYDADPSFFRCS